MKKGALPAGRSETEDTLAASWQWGPRIARQILGAATTFGAIDLNINSGVLFERLVC